MMRAARFAVAAALLALPLTMLGASAATASASAHHGRTPHQGVNDFRFASFDADYYLATDANGRSSLTTVETFVAQFPDFDQNHGMARAIPNEYQGAPTDLSIVSITDETGTARPYTVETDGNGNTVVTSAADHYVHGAQTYVFTYTQHNVTRFFQDTNDDEFYWDTNGTGWAQPFGTVTARVHVDSSSTSALTGSAACYQGAAGSTDTCELSKSTEKTASGAAGTLFTVTASNIQPYSNVTVSIGFAPHTFVPRDDSYFASPFGVFQLLAVLAAIGVFIWALVLRFSALSDGKGRPTIIAEYTPPKGLDVVTAAVILKKTTRAAAAEFVDLAVRGKIRIIETPKQGWFASGSTYMLELVDATGLAGPDHDFADALFGYQLVPGTGYLMDSKDTRLSEKVRAIIQSTTKATTTRGLRKPSAGFRVAVPSLLAIASGIGAVVFGFTLLGGSIGGGLPFLLIIPAVILGLAVLGMLSRKPLSDAGAELRDHLTGLELYIRLAEADRLRMLQSPTGAEKEAVSNTDPRQVVDIYEKLLPYAVLFSLEREWATELGKYYTDSPPDWYGGTGAFNAALFASGISSMSTSVASSYSGSVSSGSGGSGGGGSSGGGGGGGGGGGV
jgi:hypothetical protein